MLYIYTNTHAQTHAQKPPNTVNTIILHGILYGFLAACEYANNADSLISLVRSFTFCEFFFLEQYCSVCSSLYSGWQFGATVSSSARTFLSFYFFVLIFDNANSCSVRAVRLQIEQHPMAKWRCASLRKINVGKIMWCFFFHVNIKICFDYY